MLDRNQQLRYSRQIILKEVGLEGQLKLLKSKVLVIGCGGLGSPILSYLAAAGVGTIGIVDFDTVTISNLQRQILHFTDDIGKKKVDSAEEKLLRLNPDIKVVKHVCRATIDNIEEIIENYDVVIDAVDNFTARYIISDCCYFMKKPLIEGAVLGFDGILMTIIPDQSPCYRCLYPMPPQDGVVATCNDTGILGMVTGVIGSMQALEAVKVVLGIGETLSGRILTFEGLDMDIREIPWERRHDCPLCGQNPTVTELVEYEIKCKSKLV
ncbi:HesA/MoeB/ThiF family protein [Petroclostridium sp. X23]|uniref:HesA/MoeB/ThiF family protein n=1 Tax=Petroclostridium sp. X23 TaxID=3045146 RepID=UPI0024AE6A9B|nr:HesA/MoeB/ThiF family protein [Petroclostridium sp. X23]WHH57653.1 HesA/MoeB/ThiF family protein [Petroclostridium sp. X23]